MLQHKMELYGICSQCLQSDDHSMPLSMARQGDRIRIMQFSGGPRCQMRLLSMGLRIGDFVEVITSHGRGQMVVAVDCKRYVIGKGLAQKMLVERVTGDMKKDPVRLSRMKEGQAGIVVRVGGNGAVRRRILEMGIVKGSELYVEKYAPLKDPVELIVKGYHVSLRVEEARSDPGG
jgi:Fur family ferric uptake transcriptional regulator